MNDPIAKLVEQLREAPLFKFSDWPPSRTPSADRAPSSPVPTTPGVYSIWKLDEALLIYVGRAGAGETGLRGRLAAHAQGARSGDQFSIYVCDNFVLPTLDLAAHSARLAKNRRYLDEETKVFTRSNLGFRFVETESAQIAVELERAARSGALGVRPLLNPADH